MYVLLAQAVGSGEALQQAYTTGVQPFAGIGKEYNDYQLFHFFRLSSR